MLYSYIVQIWRAVLRLDRIERKLDRILELVSPAPTARVIVEITLPSGQTQSGDEKVQLTDTQQITFALNPVDKKGQTSMIDPTKTVLTPDNPAVGTAVINPDGVSGTIVAGTVGSTQFTGSVTDASDPNDVVTISPISLDVVAGSTATVAVNLGTPTEQPQP